MLAEYNFILKENDKSQKLANEAIIELEKTQDKIAKLRAQDLIEIIETSEKKIEKINLFHQFLQSSRKIFSVFDRLILNNARQVKQGLN